MADVNVDLPITFQVPTDFQELDLQATVETNVNKLLAYLDGVTPKPSDAEKAHAVLAQQAMYEMLSAAGAVYAGTYLYKPTKDDPSQKLASVILTVTARPSELSNADTVHRLARTMGAVYPEAEVAVMRLQCGLAVMMTEERKVPKPANLLDDAEAATVVRQLHVFVPIPGRLAMADFAIATENLTDWSSCVEILAEVCRTITFDDAAAAEPAGKTIEAGWSALSGTVFVDTVSAACRVPGSSSDLYLFRGDQYLRYRIATPESVVSGPKSIATGWPGLVGTRFTSGINSACVVPGSSTDLYLFHGKEYCRYNAVTDKMVTSPRAISTGWPKLVGTRFVHGVDAVCDVPGSATDVYLFAGDEYVLYKAVGGDQLVAGPAAATAKWTGLKDPFTGFFDSACPVPGSSTDIYLFKGNRYLRHKI